MKINKISTLFLVAVLALAGIGISYAGFTEQLNIFGTVQTATVEFEISEYSGTWVWKVWGEGYDGTEIYTCQGEVGTEPDETAILAMPEFTGATHAELISYAYAREPVLGVDPDEYDVIFEFSNLFPCIDFVADLKFTIGTIPVKITDIQYGPLDGQDWLCGLIENNDIYATMKNQDDVTIYEGSQIHVNDEITVEVHIHIPQDNYYQGRSGSGWAQLDIQQWNDECGEPGFVDIIIDKSVDITEPEIGEQITYTITAQNIGDEDATSVIVGDIIPGGLRYDGYDTTHGSYDDGMGVWNIGALDSGEVATLEIYATVQSFGSTLEFTQLALVLDGSGSISDDDWDIMLDGLATAVENYFPHNSMVELTVVQFADLSASQEIGPIVIDEDNFQTVADDVRAIGKRGETTPLACGLNLAADLLNKSVYYDPAYRQVINIVTDGVPNVDASGPDGYSGVFVGYGGAGETAAVTARDYLINLLDMTQQDPPVFGEDELDAEAVGSGPDVDWLRDSIVWPQPGQDSWPPSEPGWVREVNSYEEFADTIGEKFILIFDTLENCAALIECIPEDTNTLNDESCITISPQEPGI